MCGSAPSGQMGLAPGPPTGGPPPTSPTQINFGGVSPGQNSGFGAGGPVGAPAAPPQTLSGPQGFGPPSTPTINSFGTAPQQPQTSFGPAPQQPQMPTPSFGPQLSGPQGFGPAPQGGTSGMPRNWFGGAPSPAFSAGNVTGGLTTPAAPNQNPFSMLWGGY